MLALCTLFWALSFPTMKGLIQAQSAVLPGASSWFLAAGCTALRFGLAGIIIAACSWRCLGGLTRQEISQGVGLGIFGSGGIVLQMDALMYTHASTSAFLTQCYAVFIPVWLGLRHRRWPRWNVAVSCLMVMAGVAILSGVEATTLKIGRGELETVLAAFFFTAQILWLELPVFADTHPNRFSVVMFATMSAISLPIACATSHGPSDWITAYSPFMTWIFMLLLLAFCTLGGYMLMNHWQKHVPATQAGLIYCLEPVFASGFAMVLPELYSRWAKIDYPNEAFTFNLVVGGGLILAANGFLLWFKPKTA
jgi:drug/metabolite transporter (DMT)-like permease